MRQRLLAAKRWLLRSRELPQPFANLLNDELPSTATPFRQAEIVSLDIETTGLDASNADMLSVGWVVISGGRIDLDSADAWIVRPAGEVGDSATVHGLTDTVVESGHDWGIVLDKIVEVLRGRILLVHHAGLDKALLDRLCRQRYGAALLVPVIDTLAIEHRRRQRRHHVGESQALRLGDLRDAYNLPRYNAHDCLVDAIATAELLIAMVAHNGGHTTTRLSDLYV